jgi:Protein of unknown function (DUF2510)
VIPLSSRPPYDSAVSGSQVAAPGWYPDPGLVAPLRWWDGRSWTGYVSAGGAVSAGEPQSPAGRCGLRVLKVVATLTVLAAPLNALILNAAENASVAKQSCSAPLSRYQADPTFVVPGLFGAAALACLLIGIDTIVQGRRRSDQFARDSGVLAVVLSSVGLVIAAVSLFFALLIIGFSTWCF